jgi:uracil-DNA glycosylase
MSTPTVRDCLRLLRKSPRGAVFNPWWQIDADNDIGVNAARIRREQLGAYLAMRIGEARVALIGEAPSYRGGHFTGIAMTSERLLLEGGARGTVAQDVLAKLAPRRTSKPQRNPRGFSEPTATIVWNILRELHVPAQRFVLWNAFPWHPFDPRDGMLSNRRPTSAELAAGLPVLGAFLKLLPCETIVAVGRLAAKQLAKQGVDAKCVRHPASGGAPEFRRQIASIVRAP